MMSLRKRLELARDLLARGWIRGQYRSFQKGVECYCASAALSMARTGTSEYLDATPAELKALGFDDPRDIVRWNDDKRRTQASVVRRFNKAINSL